VVKRLIEVPPPNAAGVPQAVMESLCLMHPRYKDWAELRALKAEEVRLQEELEYLKNKKPDGRRRGGKASQESRGNGGGALDGTQPPQNQA